jgi:hypothetical protein
MNRHIKNIKMGAGLRNTAFVAIFIAALAVAWVPYILGHQGQQAVDQGQNLANKISIACSNKVILNQLESLGACQAAAQIQAAPAAPGKNGINGANGANGVNGINGRGIRSTNIANEHLFVTYTDNSTVDLGQIVGKNGTNGKPGSEGKQGIGITGTTLGGPSNTDLIVSRSDGTVADVGTVVGKNGIDGLNGTNGNAGTAGVNGTNGTDGKPGRSVQLVNINSDEHLIITYDDGTTDDAGPVPQGIGVQSVALENDNNGNCNLIFTLSNPANGQTSTQSVLVNPVVCPAAAPPPPTDTTTTTPPTTDTTPSG